MGTNNFEKTLFDETDKLVYQITEQGVDAIIGGSPCQDNSIANPAGDGFDGNRSGLVWEMVRTLRLVRPAIWVLENVPASLGRGMERVFGRVANFGYDLEWDCISASAAGAPHHRARIYVVAYQRSAGRQRLFTKPIQRQPEFSWCENVRSVEDVRNRSDLPEPLIRRINNGARNRLHGIGNGNPPCIIRELAKDIKPYCTGKERVE